MIIDTHVHTKFSTDSKTEPKEAVSAATAKNIGLCVTEHYDADYFKNDCDFRVCPSKYLEEYEIFRGTGVFLGIEIGLTHMSAEKNKSIAEDFPFDFVLGAVHMVGAVDIYNDLQSSNEPSITGEAYFDYLIQMTETNDFYDSLAHIDYPLRYRHAGADFGLLANIDKLRKVFLNIIERDISLELSTKRLTSKENCAELTKVYTEYAKAGGRYITIGSDAHSACQIGADLEKALDIVKECGLEPIYYCKRRPLQGSFY